MWLTAAVARRVGMLEQCLRSYTLPEKIKRADHAARRRTGNGVPNPHMS